MLFNKRHRLKRYMNVALMAAVLVCGLVGCQVDTDTGQGDTKQTVQENQQIIETTTGQTASKTQQTTVKDAISEEINERTILEDKLNVLETALMESDINCYITYGIIDYNNDGTDEFFAVFSQGNQGYDDIKFYSVDDDNIVNELFTSSGFGRDGKTYFMYDEEFPRLLILSGYEHSYFLKNEKTEAVSGDGKLSVLFDSTWQADSAEEELKQTNTYIDSSEVSIDEYNNEYDIFMGNKYKNIIYIYDGKLFGGSELISDNKNVYQDYLSRKEEIRNE